MEFLVGFVLVLGQVKWEEFLKTRVLFFHFINSYKFGFLEGI